jgi:TonB family protein
LQLAELQIGRALYLRCLCADNNLSFDAQGHLLTASKLTDWTLAGVNVLKAARKGPSVIELDAVRVAVRYATDRHEFDRHALNDDHMKLLLTDNGDPTSLQRELDAVFAQGIDLRLQHATPPAWQHYFNPAEPWPADEITGQTIVTPGTKDAANVLEPTVTHKSEPDYTPAASHDHVQGTLLLHVVVDTAGVPRRITIVQPLGYGLDERAVTAAAKLRFAPATQNGKPVAANMTLKQDFVVVH